MEPVQNQNIPIQPAMQQQPVMAAPPAGQQVMPQPMMVPNQPMMPLQQAGGMLGLPMPVRAPVMPVPEAVRIEAYKEEVSKTFEIYIQQLINSEILLEGGQMGAPAQAGASFAADPLAMPGV